MSLATSARRWIEAGKILAADKTALVRCPEHDDGTLTVHDVVLPSDPGKIERYLVCGTCGARNIILMRAPQS